MPYEASIEGLDKALAASKRLIRATERKGDLVVRMVARATRRTEEVAEKKAPWLTGSLSKSHRGQLFDGAGHVFIDPNTVNPILGGKPSEYGPVVHGREPWIAATATIEGPRIIQQEALWYTVQLARVVA